MKRFSLFLAMLAISGCAVSGAPPADNDGFYQAAKSHRFGTAQSFVVPRSVSAVANSFSKAAPRCLNVTKVTTEGTVGPRGSFSRTTSIYKSEMKRQNDTVTLNILRDGTKPLLGAPKGFSRMFMAEAKPVSGGTQIRLAGPSTNYNDVFKAISEWARGQSSRCPAFKL